MKIKTKVFFLVITVLVIGVFIGVMLNRIIIQHRIKEAFSRINPNRIPTFYERVLDPNKDHSDQIRDILSKHAKRIRNTREDYIKQIQEANQDLYNELTPYLDPVQRRRFNQELFRKRRPLQWSRRIADNFPLMKALKNDAEFLKRKLSLTKVQTYQVHEILKKYKVPLWIPRPKDNRAKNKGRLEWLHRIKERDKAIKEVLNQKQKKLYDQLRKQVN